MQKISIDEYKKLIKTERTECFKQPYDLVYDNFIKLGYHKESPDFFKNNASKIVEKLRENCWNEYKPCEKEFTSKMLGSLIDTTTISNFKPLDALINFIEQYPEYIYTLTLSNTQSRRSRAGKEFENIIELLLLGANIPMDSQGNIGKNAFINKGLGKSVDVVSPGVIEYVQNKRNTVLISAKTTLRERWAEVPEEMGRTGAREMFLATLDKHISSGLFKNLNEANIQIITTKSIKEKYYKDNHRVLDFEQLIKICLENAKEWKNFKYSITDIESITKNLKKQLLKHKSHKFVEEYYTKRLTKINNT